MPRLLKPAVIDAYGTQNENKTHYNVGEPGNAADILDRMNATANATGADVNENLQKFTKKLGESERVALIMDITGAGKNAVEVYDCGALLAWQLASAGKNVSNYVFEDRNCTSMMGNETKNRIIDECVDEIGTTPAFYIGLFGRNETTVYEDLVVVLGDRDYICNIGIKLTNNTSGG
ncbi:MAG: hypothetical protein AB1468_04715 [Candidatus Micrarchaeota archaeon]